MTNDKTWNLKTRPYNTCSPPASKYSKRSNSASAPFTELIYPSRLPSKIQKQKSRRKLTPPPPVRAFSPKLGSQLRATASTRPPISITIQNQRPDSSVKVPSVRHLGSFTAL